MLDGVTGQYDPLTDGQRGPRTPPSLRQADVVRPRAERAGGEQAAAQMRRWELERSSGG